MLDTASTALLELGELSTIYWKQLSLYRSKGTITLTRLDMCIRSESHGWCLYWLTYRHMVTIVSWLSPPPHWSVSTQLTHTLDQLQDDKEMFFQTVLSLVYMKYPDNTFIGCFLSNFDRDFSKRSYIFGLVESFVCKSRSKYLGSFRRWRGQR